MTDSELEIPVAAPKPADLWFTRFSSKPPVAPLRLAVFPFAGGGAAVFRAWARGLPGVDVFAACLPGRERRVTEAPIDHVQTLVGRMLPAAVALADRPFVLFGHSLGALIAYELARKLERWGIIPERLVVAACRAPTLPIRAHRLHDLSDADFEEGLRNYGGSPAVVLHNRELMRVLAPSLRADFRMNETYEHEPGPALTCPITAIAARLDPLVSAQEMQPWRLQTSADFQFTVVHGTHFFVVEDEAQTLTVLRRAASAMYADNNLTNHTDQTA